MSLNVSEIYHVYEYGERVNDSPLSLEDAEHHKKRCDNLNIECKIVKVKVYGGKK